MKMLRLFGISALLMLGLASVSAADGLQGQPTTPEPAARAMNLAMQQFLIQGGDIAQARPDLLLGVEANPATNFIGFVSPVFRDRTTYDGIIDTLEEAYTSADAKTKPFILYNIARIHELRVKEIPRGTARKPYLDVARKTTARFDKTFQDPGLWELKGDIESDAGNTDAAVAAYKKMSVADNGTLAASLFKTAQAYQDAGRTVDAEAAYKSALRADAASTSKDGGGRRMKHVIYQGLVSLYLQKGDYAQAATALTESARFKQADTLMYLNTNWASDLLEHSSYAQTVLDYANAALVMTPKDEAMIALRDRAAAKVQSQKPRLR